jgi:hypothetical protein
MMMGPHDAFSMPAYSIPNHAPLVIRSRPVLAPPFRKQPGPRLDLPGCAPRYS